MNTLTTSNIDISDQVQLEQLALAHSTHAGFFAWKSLQSQYICVNNTTANMIGLGSFEHVFLKNFYDGDISCPVSELAQEFCAEDQKVIGTGKSLRLLTYGCYHNGNWRAVLGEKSPLLNKDNEVIAVNCIYIDVTNTIFAKQNFLANKRKKNQFSCLIDAALNDDIELTERQLECLYLTLRGGTAKAIADRISVSKRTAETHLEALKLKFQVTSRMALIEKAISLGYWQMIPNTLL